MGFIILTIIVLIIAIAIGIYECDIETTVTLLLLYAMVIGVIFAIGLGAGQKIINKFDYRTKCIEKDEQIKQLEQSLNEQIQETEVYKDILEEYQIEGIINE